MYKESLVFSSIKNLFQKTEKYFINTNVNCFLNDSLYNVFRIIDNNGEIKMREIEFNKLKLKNLNDEERFYQFYLENLENHIENDNSFHFPTKQYEIFYLNILGGKIILLNTNYIKSENNQDQELFFDYSIALKIYNLMLDIRDGIEDEKNEFNELYKNERIQKSEEIENLKKQDEKIFQKKKEEFNIIKNSSLYQEYSKLKEENEKIKMENQRLTEEIKNKYVIKNNNIGFFEKLINKLKHKKLPIN